MKLNVWDILSIIVLLAALIVFGVVLAIFANPTSSINPFPPATLPPTIDIPTSTATSVMLPPTWTPTVYFTPTPRPTSTMFPTETPLVLPK
ncbi:MAG: hypothetical protein VB013_05365 [Anaerolineaceae bacterium]|nr:hypothetical protein [Anaerolineaceae bacterium]